MKPFPCDRNVRVSSSGCFECITVSTFRPGLGERSHGTRSLNVEPDEEVDWRLKDPSSDDLASQKSVRFDDSFNKLHVVDKKENKENSTAFWYSPEDFERFGQRTSDRVAKVCESGRTQQTLHILERANLACMSCEDEDEEVLFKEEKHELAKAYRDNTGLVGLEPFIAEYKPAWVDRYEKYDTLLSEVVKDKMKAYCPFEMQTYPQVVERKSRQVSLGCRMLAREIAEAVATSSQMD